ncbi:MAG: aldehyde dehydrogenase family protein [Terrimicrobiaceae bacterium]|nr:aldehyde dehydrogenase family protein [Terrimicrobiaceae bacterium]
MPDPECWKNHSPGDLDHALPEVRATPVDAAVDAARNAAPAWAAATLDERIAALLGCQATIRSAAEPLARRIAEETGKPLTEARGELGAAVAKFDFAIEDARRFIADRTVSDGPHPAIVRHRARGPAAIIAPFNFPIHLGHGAATAHLLGGNPVLFKPSPLAAVTGAEYGRLMADTLPKGVFQIVQGWGNAGRVLCVHPDVRAVCFTGSIPVGLSLAKELAADYSKSLALELGGKNAAIVCKDADLSLAAAAVADGLCLTAGQRCNATSRVLVDAAVLDDFLAALPAELARYVSGNPLDEKTTLGPVISAAAVDRYRALTALDVGEWIVRGAEQARVEGHRGRYVLPAIALCRDFPRLAASPLHLDEAFCPVLTITPFADDAGAIRLHNATPFGLTASIFTRDHARFERIGDALRAGNLYCNLPTTFSPSTLPFGGHGISGNGKPGARGFVRFTADEQAVQWRKEGT